MSGSKTSKASATRDFTHEQRYQKETGNRPGYSTRSDSYGSPSVSEMQQKRRDYNAGYQEWLKENPVPTGGEIVVKTSRGGSHTLSGGSSTQAGSAPQAHAPTHPATVTKNIPGAATPQVVRWEDTPEGKQAEADRMAKMQAEERKLDRMRAGRENTLLTTSDGAAGESDVLTKKLLGQ